MRIRLTVGLLALFTWHGFGQTTLNLGTQGRNADFSSLAFTRPTTVGNALPGACSVGQMFFNSAGTAGQNMYVCTAANVWIAIGNYTLTPSAVGVLGGVKLSNTSGLTVASDGTLSANFGTTSGTIAAGNDSRIQGALQSGSNLGDVLVPSVALANLGGVTAVQASAAAPVQSIAGRTGAVTLSHTDISDWSSATAGFGTGSGSSAGAISATSTASQALAGPLNGPEVNNVYHVEGYPASCTVGGVTYSTRLDCAFYTILSNGVTAATLELGSNPYGAPYDTCAGLVESATGLQIQIKGQVPGDNRSPTEIRAICPMQAVISHPDIVSSASVPYSLNISNVNIDANGQAQQCLAIFAEKVGYSEHVHCRNAIGSGAWIQFGDSNPASGYQGGGYQYHLKDILVQGSGTLQSSWATVSASQTNGVPAITVSSGGQYNYPNPPAYLFGFGAGTTPCTTMGTLTVTMSGTSAPYAVSSVTANGFAGCTGTLYAYVPDLPAAKYGISVDFLTDSTFEDLVVANVGQIAGIEYTHGSNRTISEHPYGGMPTLVWDQAANTHIGAELDTPIHLGAEADNAKGSWTNTAFTWGTTGGVPNPGASGFYAPSGLNLFGNTCTSAPMNSNGFNLVVGSSGPFAHGTTVSYGWNYLILGGTQCDNLAAENWVPSISGLTLNLNQDNASTSSLNVGSGGNSANFIGISGSRAKFGYTGVDAVVQSTGGVEFDTSGTFGLNKVSGITATGISYTAVGSAIASGTIIAPATSFVHVTGTAQINNIAIPAGCSTAGYACTVTIVPDGAFTTSTNGDIAAASTAIVGKAMIFTYDPSTSKWYPSY